MCDAWVNVRERLPDDDVCVLVYVPEGADQVWVGYVDGGVWRMPSGTAVDVTHWMPFPEPPDERS